MIPNSTENRTTIKSASESSIEAITIVIADDHPVVREGLVAIFKSQKDIKVVGFWSTHTALKFVIPVNKR